MTVNFQEVDIAGVTMPITKHGYIVKDVNQLADTLRKAFEITKSGRPARLEALVPCMPSIPVYKGL